MKLGDWKEQVGGYRAFVPAEFPPKEGWGLSAQLQEKHSSTMWHVGKLDGRIRLLPDVDFFLSMYIRKDAEKSSQIEGTRATLIDAIEAEAATSDALPDDVDDILHYVEALKYGLDRLKSLPFSLRFIRELHKELMLGARTTQFADPGEFRHSQNRIGGTSLTDASFVPPPPSELTRVLGDFERFVNSRDHVLPLIKAGIIHAQFETIHPFLDGNGRTGRLLVTVYLWQRGLLEMPVLFLSSFFKKHRGEYYDRLDGYRTGGVEAWLDFFLEGVIDTTSKATSIADSITVIRQEDMEKIQQLGKKSAAVAVPILRQLFLLPVVNVAVIQKWTGYSQPGAQQVINRLVKLGILEQKDKTKKYGRSFIYRRYVDAFGID